MKSLFWIIPSVIALIAIAAVYLGGGGKTRLHRVAATSGALSILGLLGLVPVAITTALSGFASTHDVPYQHLPQLIYFAVLGVAVMVSVVTTFLLAKRRGPDSSFKPDRLRGSA
jgi:cytochrome bd-type quinol oxidase subunit 2